MSVEPPPRGRSRQVLDRLPGEAVERFSSDLDALVPSERRIGVAVSGGPDSIALMLLAAAARPGRIIAATVNHGLRADSRKEAEEVATLCRALGVAHHILPITWAEKPDSAIQERAREARYASLDRWGSDEGVASIATGHHADDQAETVLMRLARGSGVTGLAGMRPAGRVPGGSIALIRPLLGWRRSELADLCALVGIAASDDPSNADPRFERVRVRHALAGLDFLDPLALSASASHLAEADEALAWAADDAWQRACRPDGDGLIIDPSGLPAEIRRRLLLRALAVLAAEGADDPIRGQELKRLVATIEAEGTATLRGVRCKGGKQWTFAKAPPRKGKTTAQ